MPEQVSERVKEWRCWFCDDVFTDEQSAKEHFGAVEHFADTGEGKPPACVSPLRTDEKARMAEVVREREHAITCQRNAEKIAEDACKSPRGNHSPHRQTPETLTRKARI